MKLITILIVLLLTGCGGGVSSQISKLTSLTQLGAIKSPSPCISYKSSSGIPVGPVESTPIVWNGHVLLITGNSHSGITDGTFRIDTFDCKTNIGTIPATGFAYVNAFTNAGTLYVFGAVNSNTIQMVSSNDPALKIWTSPVTVLSAPGGVGFFNTSITSDPSGFVMAIESHDPNYPEQFVTKFARSSDLASWSLLPTAMRDVSGVTNCPWIWFNSVDGNYYVMYLNAIDNREATLISRSADLNVWQMSARINGHVPFVAPNEPVASFQVIREGNNNSDVAAIEFNGVVYFTYARGDQTSWLELSTATYQGSLNQYVTLFFP